MEGVELDRSLYDLGETDLKDFWGSESLDSSIEGMSMITKQYWQTILDNQSIILHDRMMTDAVQSPRIQSEHSYSLSVSDDLPDSPLSITPHMKLDDYDLESECFPAIPMSTATGQTEFSSVITIKQEPSSPPPRTPSPLPTLMTSVTDLLTTATLSPATSSSSQQSLLRQPAIVLASRLKSTADTYNDYHLVIPKLNIKLESAATSQRFPLPPTPPSCNSSDSEGSVSPVHNLTMPTSSHTFTLGGVTCSTSSTRKSPFNPKVLLPSGIGRNLSNSSLISYQPKGATGVLNLTEEEKRTLVAEGYPIPQRLPLTKGEERSLKKIRRKIKNKISAQESRRKKKEYVDALEKRVEKLTSENSDFKKIVDSLENNNKSLISQLQKLKALVGEECTSESRTVAIQASELNCPMDTSLNELDFMEVNNALKR
ncbi:cyclic AMP-responsive element-binding protein 3-like protein 2 isoform X2 [Limulus polyphemus]|uniref:Cyclic AMP-responsive element-binding protein 3-like protein 2 isoform X2 n=1 Tax=Limulus polyphemus TaxID=6850 RepID=A0ABM1SEX6_LIMPO|nr:cyclic AMP-responsive element-binding protein 3-like protein 2 isoform X2 [Limulus polyphemus]